VKPLTLRLQSSIRNRDARSFGNGLLSDINNFRFAVFSELGERLTSYAPMYSKTNLTQRRKDAEAPPSFRVVAPLREIFVEESGNSFPHSPFGHSERQK
jgi:hypothetical protein